jgi:hypothetical protein
VRQTAAAPGVEVDFERHNQTEVLELIAVLMFNTFYV